MARALPIALLALLALFPRAYADAPIAPLPPPMDIHAYARQEALQAHISPSLVNNVIMCESGWNAAVGGDYRLGEPTSWGLVQIHLPAHPTITKEEALDPYFSIDYLVEQLAKGKGSQWTCFTLLYK